MKLQRPPLIARLLIEVQSVDFDAVTAECGCHIYNHLIDMLDRFLPGGDPVVVVVQWSYHR